MGPQVAWKSRTDEKLGGPGWGGGPVGVDRKSASHSGKDRTLGVRLQLQLAIDIAAVMFHGIGLCAVSDSRTGLSV